MSQRYQDRGNDSAQPRPRPATSRRSLSPVLALQRAVGNRGTTRVLARDASSGRGTFDNSVRIGKLGPIEITASNIGDWIGKKADVDDLTVTTAKGKHSDELKRLSESKTRVDTIEVTSLSGQNSWVVVTFKHALIAGYAVDPSGKTEQWKATQFDAVDIKRTSIGAPRP
jgi:hypothetical protein